MANETKIYKTQEEFVGPWHLDHNALKKLNLLINEQFEKLLPYKLSLLDKRVNERVNEWKSLGLYKDVPDDSEVGKAQFADAKSKIANTIVFATDEKEFSFTLSNGTKRIFSNLEQSFVDHEMQDKTITEFSANLKCGAIQGRISIRDYAKNKMMVETSPNTDQYASDLFVSLGFWAVEHRCSYPIRTWSAFGSGSILLCTALVMFLGLFGVKPSENGIDLVKEEARKLSKKEIPPQEAGRAMQLILSILTESNPDPNFKATPSTIKPWYRLIATPLLILGVMLQFYPKTAFGIGNGTRTIHIQRAWIYFITVTVFGILCTGAFQSVVGNLYTDIIKK